MTFGTTPTTVGQSPLQSNQFSVIEVYTPNTSGGNFTALQGGPVSTDSNGNASAPVSSYVYDGNNVTQGSMGDANTANTMMGRLTKIRDILNGFIGQQGKSASLSVTVASDQPALPMNLTQVNSATLSVTNPMLVEQNISNWTRNGQAYSAVAFQQIGSSAAGWYALSVFNPNTSGKNVLVYSLKGFNNGGASLFYLFKNTSNPSLASTITPANQNFGGAASVLTSGVTWNVASGITFPSSTTIDATGATASQLVECITNGGVILLPSGSSYGVQLVTYVNNSASYGLTAKWIEY